MPGKRRKDMWSFLRRFRGKSALLEPKAGKQVLQVHMSIGFT